ncbi:helix-turn-helix transcriptional regulator [Leptolyngbya sp. AN03gr2]|uniref:helix-turn-helix transcriptional regulator n=1 Tax=unclassified Leptolyngbya TaxID=2650499 RepID=UPI003D317947
MKISEQDYIALFQDVEQNQTTDTQSDYSETVFRYPAVLAEGQGIDIEFRQGFLLQISNYQFHRPVSLDLSECEHPLEFGFQLAGSGQTQYKSFHPGETIICGCGMAPSLLCEPASGEQQQEVVVHIEPEVFKAFVGIHSDEIPSSIQHLFRRYDQKYFTRAGIITSQMQTALQQILQCPFEGLIKRMYLESKVLELMALQLQQGVEAESFPKPINGLEREIRDRVQQAKEILEKQLDHPPSELMLAELVGLSHYQLKQGFRKAFGVTPFQYLHQYRMEQARLLLSDGKKRVSEVAIAVGYSHFGQFAATFKRRFGITPSECLKGKKP